MPVTSQVTAAKRMMCSSSCFLISLLILSYMGSRYLLSAIPGKRRVGSSKMSPHQGSFISSYPNTASLSAKVSATRPQKAANLSRRPS